VRIARAGCRVVAVFPCLCQTPGLHRMFKLAVAAPCCGTHPTVTREQRQRHAHLTTGMAAFRDWGSSPGVRDSGNVPAPHLFRCGRGHGLQGRDTDRAMLRKGNARVKECLRHPFDSIVKPEPLKGGVSGFRSRRTCRDLLPVSGARRDAEKEKSPDRGEGAVQAEKPGPRPQAPQFAGSAGAYPRRQRWSSFA